MGARNGQQDFEQGCRPVLDLEAIIAQVAQMMVSTFGFSQAEADHRLTLWRSNQHDLEGQLLEARLATMDPKERERALNDWVLQGFMLETDLKDGLERLEPERPLTE